MPATSAAWGSALQCNSSDQSLGLVGAAASTGPPKANPAPVPWFVNQVETALYNSYGTRQVSQIFAPNNQYQVILQVAPEFQKDPTSLHMLYVRSNTNQLIPLDTVAREEVNTIYTRESIEPQVWSSERLNGLPVALRNWDHSTWKIRRFGICTCRQTRSNRL